jgi:hypothetical protein
LGLEMADRMAGMMPRLLALSNDRFGHFFLTWIGVPYQHSAWAFLVIRQWAMILPIMGIESRISSELC